MSSRPKQSRAYSSAVRTEQAKQTRGRVLDAATRLFLERGYTSTTVAAVAQAAGVSPETIYATFDAKRGLLEGVIDASIMGPGTTVPLEEQQQWEMVARQPTPRARLRAYVALSCEVLARTSAIHNIIRGAADTEPFAGELSARLLRERLSANAKRLRICLGDQLPEGVSFKRAAERYCALTSPELHHLVTVKLGWSLRAHREWRATLVEKDLLGDA